MRTLERVSKKIDDVELGEKEDFPPIINHQLLVLQLPYHSTCESNSQRNSNLEESSNISEGPSPNNGSVALMGEEKTYNSF